MCWQGTFRAQAAFPVLSLKPDAERTISAAGGSTMRHSVVVAAYEGLEQTWHPMVDFLRGFVNNSITTVSVAPSVSWKAFLQWTFLLAAEATARYKISQDDNHARIIVFFECKIHEVLFWTRAPDKSGQHAQTQPPSGFFFLRFLRISSQVPFVGPIKGDALLNNHNLETNSKVTQVTQVTLPRSSCASSHPRISPVSTTLATWGSSSPLERDK